MYKKRVKSIGDGRAVGWRQFNISEYNLTIGHRTIWYTVSTQLDNLLPCIQYQPFLRRCCRIDISCYPSFFLLFYFHLPTIDSLSLKKCKIWLSENIFIIAVNVSNSFNLANAHVRVAYTDICVPLLSFIIWISVCFGM